MGEDGAEETIREYYSALRAGDPLHRFFADREPVVKVGIGERLVGTDAVVDGLKEQTRTTDAWEVESRDLHVGEGGGEGGGDGEDELGDGDAEYAWFGDDVFLAWTDVERNVRFEFETRWTGAMVRRDDDWRFVTMHVSTPGET